MTAIAYLIGFNTQPPEGGWPSPICDTGSHAGFNTQPPEGGWHCGSFTGSGRRCFNTQPPEGGWILFIKIATNRTQFQHTAARRRLAAYPNMDDTALQVSTHSRPKAAGRRRLFFRWWDIGFNTQPPEGGWFSAAVGTTREASFQHTAARRRLGQRVFQPAGAVKFQHTAARRRLVDSAILRLMRAGFQHTAARRRLGPHLTPRLVARTVSTHSRPKAAGSCC